MDTLHDILKRLSSRKFLTALLVQIAACVAIFTPGQGEVLESSAVKIAELVVLVLAALGYGVIEASVDRSDATRPGQ